MVNYIPYSKIDKQKWDTCITNAPNGNIYAYSFYLDTMAANWDALILDDYKTVMPVTWKKKWGISYLYQPFFCASLGIFGENINSTTIALFLNAIPSRFRYWDIYLNAGNFFKNITTPFYPRNNFILPLNKPYEDLYAGYRTNVKRNIRKCGQYNFISRRGIDINDIIRLAAERSRAFSPVTMQDYFHFRNIALQYEQSGKAVSYGIYSAANELLASAVFLFSHKRAYYILVGNHPNGKTMGASHTLIDSFIRDHAGQDLTLDFEGGDLDGLSFFYSSFGAIPELYPGLRINRLPFFIKWMKK